LQHDKQTVLVHASFQTLGEATRSALVPMCFVNWTTTSSTARLARVLTTLSYRTLQKQINPWCAFVATY